MGEPFDKDGEELRSLIDAANVAWMRVYGECAPAENADAAHRRIHMLADDVLCGRANFKAANAAYVKADAELQALKGCARSAGMRGTEAAPEDGLPWLRTPYGTDATARIAQLERERDALLASQPVWKWDLCGDNIAYLYYGGYWFVKRSHAQRHVEKACAGSASK